MHIRNAIFYLFLAGLVIGFYFLTKHKEIPFNILLGTIPIAILWLISILFVYLGFPHKAYLLREHDILFKSGYLNRKTTAIPKNRIQHVEIRQSFLARLFGLSKLLIFTAGGNSSDLAIPGLSPELAQQLKEHISNNISQHE